MNISKDTLTSLEEVAASRNTSVEALLKFYIGQGLREDIAKLFNQHLLNRTAQVLSRHIQSEEEISLIMQEIQSQISNNEEAFQNEDTKHTSGWD